MRFSHPVRCRIIEATPQESARIVEHRKRLTLLSMDMGIQNCKKQLTPGFGNFNFRIRALFFLIEPHLPTRFLCVMIQGSKNEKSPVVTVLLRKVTPVQERIKKHDGRSGICD